MKKIILVVIVLLLAGGAWLFMNFDSEVRAIIEAAGTKAVGTQVSVGSFQSSLAARSASLGSISVANPKGFSSDSLLKTKKISVTLADVSTKLVTIKQVVVDGMAVSYELGQNGTNLDALENNMKTGAGKNTPSPAPQASTSSPELIIEELRITNAQATVSVPGLAEKKINLPDIVLTNIGTKSNPATPVEVASQVVAKVIQVSSNAVIQSGISPKELLKNVPQKDLLEKGLKGLKL